jgi:hypothetical protein
MADITELAKFSVPPIVASIMVVMFVFVLYSLFQRSYKLSLICGILFLISFMLTFTGPMGARIMSKFHEKRTQALYVPGERQATREYNPPAEEPTESFKKQKS